MSEVPDPFANVTTENPPVEDTKDDNGEWNAAPATPDLARYQAFLAWERSQANQPAAAPERPEEWYVHLANGDVKRVKESDFPDSLTVDTLGHYETNGPNGIDVHHVIGVYPVEINTGRK